jgi:hypothetical protein
MEILPTELWIKIFKILDVESKLDLTLVCRRFKTIIEDSPELMKNIKLFFERKKPPNYVQQMASSFPDIVEEVENNERKSELGLNTLMQSTRKYQHIRSHIDYDETHESIYNKFGCHLKSIEMKGSLSKTTLNKIFVNLQSIESATIDLAVETRMSMISNPDISIPQIFPNLEYLEVIQGADESLELFRKSSRKLKNLKFNQSWSEFFELENLNELLVECKHLKFLSMPKNVVATELFTTDFLEQVEFQLKELVIEDIVLQTDNSRINFLSFIDAQSELELIDLRDSGVVFNRRFSNFFEVLLRKEKLKTIRLDMGNFVIEDQERPFRRLNPTIESLSFRLKPGMVNVKKNYVINGKISYLMIIFDYHYQIKINVNFSHGLS